MASVENKRKDLNLKEKLSIIERYDKLPKMSQRSAAVQLQISQPLLCKLLKNRDSIVRAGKENQNLNCKRFRGGKDNEVESALKLWFTNVREQDARVDGPLMRQKAEELAKKMGKDDFVATEGWFHRWKKRENIVYKRMHGEQKDADFSGAERWIEEEWPKIISMYSPDCVFNADETGLYYRALPEHTYLFKNESAKGCKTSKGRLTVLCCVNMNGDKERLLVIGKSKNPRCFKGVKKFPVDYHSNSNAWMTALIFKEWLLKWDSRLNRKIVLLIDNCTAHNVNCELKNINLVFLPANTTSLIQPCDQGIIRTLKGYYRHEMRTRILENMENTKELSANDLAKQTNVLEALHLLAMSWNNVSGSTIRNCFKHGGFSKQAPESEDTADIRPLDMTVDEFQEWMEIDEDIIVAARPTEDDVCEAATSSDSQVGEEEAEAEDDDATEPPQPPTNAEMREALKVLRCGVQHRSVDFQKHYEYERFINDLLRENQRQTTIKDFFN